MRDEGSAAFFLVIIFSGTLFFGGLVGNTLFEPSIIQRGRNEGIIFCTENQKNVKLNTLI